MESFSRIWLHVIFSTKNREPLVLQEFESKLFEFMKAELKKQNCLPLRINGMPDHVHLLFLSDHRKSTSDIVKQVKGASSYWWNSQKFTDVKLRWQEGYRVFSVSESMVAIKKAYIDNQKRHHSKLTFSQECDELLKEHQRESEIPREE